MRSFALLAAAAAMAALALRGPAAAQDFCGGLRTLERSAERDFSDVIDTQRNRLGSPRGRRVLPDALTAEIQTAQGRDRVRTVSYIATFGGWSGIGRPNGSLVDRVRGCYPAAQPTSEARAGGGPTTWFQIGARTRIGVEETTQGQEYLAYVIVERRSGG
ncbi:MAG: hypothetical protein JNL66_20920 [Alphaproteobacteria bacterium]|nr:hypothetical protein [Alphaproteobacteria bacterium]